MSRSRLHLVATCPCCSGEGSRAVTEYDAPETYRGSEIRIEDVHEETHSFRELRDTCTVCDGLGRLSEADAEVAAEEIAAAQTERAA